MLLHRFQVIYHRAGTGEDPLMRRATVGVKIDIEPDAGEGERRASLRAGSRFDPHPEQHGHWTSLDAEDPREALRKVAALCLRLADELDGRSLLHERSINMIDPKDLDERGEG